MPENRPRRGDIYHVEFDEPVGPHYAVVVTSDAINRNADTILLAVISSKNMDEVYPHEFRVPPGLLPKASKVKGNSIIAWPKAALTAADYQGTIDDRDIQGLDVALMKALDLWY